MADIGTWRLNSQPNSSLIPSGSLNISHERMAGCPRTAVTIGTSALSMYDFSRSSFVSSA
jgi:hypothetical protein